MKNTDIYLLMEKHGVPKTMMVEINGEIWPIYNGENMKGVRLVNSLSSPEERVRLVICSHLDEMKEKYIIEQRTQKKGTQQIDVYLPRLQKALELKPEDVFDLDKHLFETQDYLHFCKDTILITYNFNTKQIIAKNMNGEKKHYNHMGELIYGDNLIKSVDLVNITNEGVPTIINNMLQILYSNNVSDYTKGLDVIVKLLACKNMDEKKNYRENDIVELQVINNESDDSFINKIISLYLDSTKELNNQVDEKYMCTQTSFYLIEVEDELSYNKNTKILKELVEQIQRFKFVNVGNVDFITKLFEELENNKTLKDYGIYITDSNITNFITQSLPLYEYIEENKNPILRYQDPAVGTGHFPNSFINEYSKTIEKLKDDKFRAATLEGNEHIDNFHLIKNNYIKNNISGIDVQKRNIELCRLNTTLKNGEQIKCYHANTLQKDILRKKYPQSEDFMNCKLDVITSNYPFSVKGFIKDLKESLNIYDLSKFVTEKSQQIENLFLEDTIQKLKEGGVAGFVIFESVLWKKLLVNDMLRYKLLVECELISIVKMGSEAFKNTGTKSVIMFLRKRKKDKISKIEKNVNLFFANYQKVIYDNVDIIQEYIDSVHGISFEEYVELLVNQSKIKGKDGKNFIKKEKENLIVFFLNHGVKIIYSDLSFEGFNDNTLTDKQNQEIIKKKQREILGMSKSSYDENKYQSSDYLPKLSKIIRDSFYGDRTDFILNNMDIETVVNINDVVNFEIDGGYVISFDGNSIDYLTEDFSECDFISLGEIVDFYPKTKHRADDGIIGGDYPFYTCTSDDEIYKTTNIPDREGERLLINNGGESYIRKTENGSLWSASGDIIIMSSKHEVLTNSFIFKFLKQNPKVLEWTYKGSGLKHSSIGRLKKIAIPLLSGHEVEKYLN
jgi:type I restriction-modification system DNA methylase subunit